MDLAAALRNRPLAIVAASKFSARCTNSEALQSIYRDSQPECSDDENPCRSWLLGGRLRRVLGEELPTRLESELRREALGELADLAAMPIDLVLTTSMGQGWEQAFGEHEKIVHSIVPGQPPDYDYDAVVYHLFGKASAPDSLVLSGSDFESAIRETGVRALVRSWSASRVFVFLGFDLHDGELQHVLQTLLPPGSKGEHFAFMAGLSLTERTELESQFGVQVLADTALAVSKLCSLLKSTKHLAHESADLDAIMARAAQDSRDPAIATSFELLEHRLRQDGSYERLVDVHVARLAVAEEAAERQRILLETASLLEHKMGDTERSFHATLSAYRELADKSLWPSLQRRATTHESKELLAETLMESRPSLRKADRLPVVLLAVSCYREVGDTGRAIEAISLVATNPDEEDQVASLHRTLLEEAERWYELARALARAADRANFHGEREEHLMDRALVLQDRLNEPWAAIECYQQVLALNASNTAALEAIERLFLHLHQVPALLDLLYDYGDRHTVAELHAKLWRLGERCKDRGDHTGAVLCFEKLRDEEPSNQKVLEQLSELYAELGETSHLVEILKAKVGASRAGDARANLCEQLAMAHEELNNLEEAAECWEWVFHDAPSSSEAVVALERLYRRAQNWQALLALYSRQRELASGQDKRRWIFLMAELYQHQLAEFGPAIDLLSGLRENEPENAELAARILLLLEHAGRYGEAAELSDELASKTDGSAEGTLRQHAAKLWQQHGETAKAIKSLEAATKASPNRADLHNLLAECLRSAGEQLRAAEEFDKASLFSTGFESTKYALLAARCFEDLNATDRGIKVLEHRWLSGSEERIVAVELRRLYEARGRHADLISLLENQNERVRQEEKLEQLLAMADAHAALGQWREEIECLQRAVTAFPERTDIAKQLAETALGRQMWDVAEDACQSLLSGESNVEDQTAAYCLLARRSFELGDRDAALEHLSKARERVPFDRRALSLLVELSADQPEAQIGYLRALLLDAPAKERAELLVKIGDVCRDELGEQAEARDAYHNALLLDPDDHLLLHRCLAIAVAEREWDESLEYLDHLIQTEEDPSVRARYRSTTAHLYEEELGDIENAMELLWQAAEEAPDDQNILRRLASHLRSRKDWPALLDCTSRLLAALRDDPEVAPEVHANAWHDLAELCRDELGDRETALCSLEVAVSLQPASLDYRDKLAELYQADGRNDDCIAQHQAILDLEPSLLPSYTALARLFESKGNVSAAQACQQAVSTMCGESPKDIPVPTRRRETIDLDRMKLLQHPDDSFTMGRLLALMTPAIAALIPPRRRRSTLSGRKSLSAKHPFVSKVEQLAKQLGVHNPNVYHEPDAATPMQIGVERSGEQLVPVISVSSEALVSLDSPKTTFELCRTLVTLRREYLVRAVQPDLKSLGHTLDAILELANSKKGAAVSKTATALSKFIDPQTFDQLREVGSKMQVSKQPGYDIIKRWHRAGDMTASRVALWVGQDLLAGLAGIEDAGLGERETEESRQDLIRVFCSPLIRDDMRAKPTKPLTKTPHETSAESSSALGKSRSLRQDFRNIARTVTEEIRLDSL